MPSTTRTRTSVFVPYLSCRRPSERVTSSQRRTRCARTSTAAAIRYGRSPPGSAFPRGVKRSHARAAIARMKPRGARKSTSFFMALRPPPLALDRLVGQEEAEGDDAQVEDEVLQVHDPLHEVLEV